MFCFSLYDQIFLWTIFEQLKLIIYVARTLKQYIMTEIFFKFLKIKKPLKNVLTPAIWSLFKNFLSPPSCAHLIRASNKPKETFCLYLLCIVYFIFIFALCRFKMFIFPYMSIEKWKQDMFVFRLKTLFVFVGRAAWERYVNMWWYFDHKIIVRISWSLKINLHYLVF